MYLLVPLIEVVLGLALLTVLTISGRQHHAQRPFSIFLFFMTLWGLLLFMMRASADMETALVWEKFVFWAILTASLFFFRFAVALTGARPKRYLKYSLYATYLAVLSLVPTGLVVRGIQMMWFGKAPVDGPLFPLYVLCAVAPVIWSAVILVKYHQHTRNINDRVRAQYITAGIAAMLIGVITDYLPAVGISTYPLGIAGNILFCLIATTAMLTHNLLDMQVVLRKITSYLLTTLLLFAVFGSIIYLLSNFFYDFLSPIAVTITMVTVFIAALLFQPVLSRLQHTVDRWFFQERYDHIQTLKRFSRDAKSDLDLEQLSTSFVETVANGMQCQGVFLLLPVPASGNFITYNFAGQKNPGEMHFPANSPLVAAMTQHNGVVDCNEMEVIPSFVNLPSNEREILENDGIELMVPLQSNSQLAGMLLLGRKISHEPYSYEERQLLQAVSTEVAINIDIANHFENMKRKHGELQKAMNGITHAVSLLVGSRDPYTAGHQRRVAELSRAIAKEIGLSDWQTEGIFITGLLHDVGKVCVPSEILSKPGKINANEFDIIKNHCQVGYNILQRIEFPWPVTRAILQHHERLDGSGYPGGLVGDDIILEARVLGVADVVEAMSSHRPYRPALGLDSALAEIKRGSGFLYDPEIVDACLRLLRKNEPEFDRLMAAAEASDELVLEVIR